MSARLKKPPRCPLIAYCMCALLLLTGTAGADFESFDAEWQSFVGHFTIMMYLREEPDGSAKVLVQIPANTRLRMAPVTEKYAWTAYKGRSGYVYYGDVVIESPADAADNAFIGYSRSVLFAYAEPHNMEEPEAFYPPFTPLRIAGSNGRYFRIETGSADTRSASLYVPMAPVRMLAEDVAVVPREAYLRDAALLFAHPLSGAEVLAVLPRPSYLQVTAHNEDYARVLFEKGQSGYVLRSALAYHEEARPLNRLGFLKEPVPLYSAPNRSSATDEYVKAGTLVDVDASVGDFSRIGDGRYVMSDAVTRLYPKKVETFGAFWETPQPLYANTSGVLLPTGGVLPANTVVELSETIDDFYLVRFDNMLGLAGKKGMQLVGRNRTINQIAVYAHASVPLKAHSFEGSPEGPVLPAGTRLWLSEKANGLYRVAEGGAIGYADISAFELIGETVAVRPFEAYLHRAAALVDFPHRTGEVIARLPSNTLARVVAQNGAHYYVQHPGGEGYIPQDSVWMLDDRQRMPDTYEQKYYLFLNKATRELTAYYADANGNRTSRVVWKAVAAIGKATTPTPSGVFELGRKERWHQFGETSFAPFVVYYAPGRYLHGPLYDAESERTLKVSRLDEFGSMASGGCIRMPYDNALWIYTHCRAGNTTLEIVSGI